MKGFKIGEFIQGKAGNEYSVTNEDMIKAEVIDLDFDLMEIKVLEHKNKRQIGETYRVENNIEKFDYFNMKITEESLYYLPIGSMLVTDYEIENNYNIFLKLNDNEFVNNDADYLTIKGKETDFIFTEHKVEIYGGVYNIIRIEEPNYKTLYKRVEEQKPKEMTIKEISEILGYDVKIIKE